MKGLAGFLFSAFFGVVFLMSIQGCVATRSWVNDQISPVSARLSDTDGRVSQIDGRVNDIGGRLSGAETRLAMVDGKADKALNGLGNLRLERKLVLDMRDGANFAFNSSALTGRAKKEIDSFLSDLKGDLEETNNGIFLIAGHTDGAGSDAYNYELGRKRADSVATYLVTRKKVDPLRVITVSYGKSAPVADNATKLGREKNRRVEILVYKEGITSGTPETSAQQGKANTGDNGSSSGQTSMQEPGERMSRAQQ